MGVRPPQDNDASEPETIEFGIAAVDARLRESDLDFPASVDAVERTIGDEPVPFDATGSTVTLDVALAETGRESFETRQELMNALHPVFEEYRATRSGSLFGRIRGLLPF